MFSIKGTFRRKALTLDQKALKRACATVGKEIRDAVRRAVPRQSGALYYSIAAKTKSDKESNAYCVVGTKTRYSKMVKGVLKIPNLYAGKVEEQSGALAQFAGATTVSRLKDEVKKLVEEMKNA